MLGNHTLINRRNHNDIDDHLTVQISTANSLLGTHLLEGDWDEALQYLATPEGNQDALANNDPLGLFNSHSNSFGSGGRGDSSGHSNHIPRSKTTAIFAALYVRAPIEVIETIYEQCSSSQADQHEDLMYALSVIPSEEEERLKQRPLHQRQRQGQRGVTNRARAWTRGEYDRLLHLLLKHFFLHDSQSISYSPLLNLSPSWIISNYTALTPLAMAAYNPDVSPSILRLLCTLMWNAHCLV